MINRPKKSTNELELTGKPLKIYLYLLKTGGAASLSDIQKYLGFKNPSHALYYLEKLIKMGLVKKDERGVYSLSKEVKIGVLKQFVRIGRLMLPRFLFYATFMTTMLITYVLKYAESYDPFVLLFGLIGSIILWIEAIRIWREKPI